MPEDIETTTPEYPFPWMPLAVGDIEIVGHDGYSYVDRAGRTYWSGEAPSAEDAEDAVNNPRTPPAPVPTEVTRPRFIIALRKVLSLDEGAIYALISQLPASEARDDVRDWFTHGVFFRRDDSTLNQFAAANGVTPEQLDSVFRAAAQA